MPVNPVMAHVQGGGGKSKCADEKSQSAAE
jgi:hypothetical protein